MKLTPNQVQHIAEMARIHLSETEIIELIPDLNSILNLIQTLDEIDLKNIPQIDQITGLKNITEDDIIQPFLETDKLVECSPLPKKNNMIQVQKSI